MPKLEAHEKVKLVDEVGKICFRKTKMFKMNLVNNVYRIPKDLRYTLK